MEMSGSVHITADRQTVWDALLNPDVLMQCVPGCQEMAGTPDDGFTATVVQKVGPVKATFKGAVQLSNIRAPESYTITGEGKGGAAGHAKGGADVALREDGEHTMLTYDVKAQVGGKLAQLGSRLIDSTARKLSAQFFTRFGKIVEAGQKGAADETAEKQGLWGRLRTKVSAG